MGNHVLSFKTNENEIYKDKIIFLFISKSDVWKEYSEAKTKIGGKSETFFKSRYAVYNYGE